MTGGLPSLAIAIILVALLLAGLEAGWRGYGRLKRGEEREGGSTGAGYLVGASLGLLSLLIGFTLALSLDRYEDRRHLVVAEADAISTVWLRDHLLGQPFQAPLDGLLRDYVRERRGLASVGTSRTALDAADRRTEALQQRIWEQTGAALRAPGAAALTVPVLQATNEMFGLPATRRAALDAQVPGPVLWVLVAVAVLSSAVTGYGLAAARRPHRVAAGALFVAVALIITLIFELDEPRTGLIRVSQTPIDRVAAEILSQPAPAAGSGAEVKASP